MLDMNAEGEDRIMKLHDLEDKEVTISYEQVSTLQTYLEVPTVNIGGVGMAAGAAFYLVELTLRDSSVVKAARRHRANDSELLTFILSNR